MTYRAKMKLAGTLARQRATRWCAHVETKQGTVTRYVDAESEEEVLRLIEAPNGRRLKRPPLVLRVSPTLGSTAWRAIYEEVGL